MIEWDSEQPARPEWAAGFERNEWLAALASLALLLVLIGVALQ